MASRIRSAARRDARAQTFARPHIEMLKEPAPRSGFFEYDEFVKVRDLLPAEVQPLVEFIYITGWRWNSEARLQPNAELGRKVATNR